MMTCDQGWESTSV